MRLVKALLPAAIAAALWSGGTVVAAPKATDDGLRSEPAAEAAADAEAMPAAQDEREEPAQRSGAATLEAVTVTAQRRAEPLQQVPIAVSAFSPQQLERASIDEPLKLARVVPNLIAHNNTGLGSANVYALRGLSNTESIATFDPPVGTYVDDVFIARQNANNFSLFDVERVEVLRGPQGTLFGRNTTGGAVSIVMRKPGDELGGYASVGVGAFGRFGFRAGIDVPLSDTVLTKFSAYRYEDDGYVDNPITDERLNGYELWGIRGAVRWLISDLVTWDVSLDRVYSDELNLLNFSRDALPENRIDLARQRFQPGYLSEAFRASRFCADRARRDRFSCTTASTRRPPGAGLLTGRKADIPLGSETETTSLISNLEWLSDVGTVNWITGWRRTEQRFAIDFFNGNFFVNNPTVANPNPPPATIPAPVGTPFPGAVVGVGPAGGFTIANDAVHRQFTTELKLTGLAFDQRLSYVAGAFLLRERNRTDFGDLFGISPALTLVLEDRLLRNDTDSFAVYAQGDWDFGGGWVGTLGLRWTDESKDIDYVANPNPRISRPACTPQAPQNCRVESATIARFAPLKQDTSLLTPRVVLRKDFSPDLNVYASATRGFKSGGWNARGTTPDQIQPFSAEKIWSYELGLRSEWLDNTLRVNLTAFHFDVEDFQLPSAFTQASGAIAFITRNFAGLRNSGLEAEVLWVPIEDLTLFANLGIQNARYADLDPSILAQQARCRAALAGSPLPPATNAREAAVANCALGIVDDRGEIAEPVRTPDTLALGASYRIGVGDGWGLEPSLTWTRFGRQNMGTNGNPVALSGAYSMLTFGLTLDNPGSAWSARLACENCTDREHENSVLGNLPYLSPPRTWTFDVSYRF
jgi:iron complex outermembrane receptor protein